MPWPKEHKARTRERIVNAAATAFRARGAADVRVEDVMSSVGLTHGGFYAHFASKDALLCEALMQANNQALEGLAKALGSIPRERRLHAVIDAYLNPGHVANPARGCPVAALGPELTRTGGDARQQLARGVRQRIEWLRNLHGEGGGCKRDSDEAIGALACMVGGLILARVVGSRLSTDMVEACGRFLHRAIEDRRLDRSSRGRGQRPRRGDQRRSRSLRTRGG